MPPPWNPTDHIDAFVEGLEELYGSELVSVVLYGSVARGEAVEGRSDVNLLVLLRTVEPTHLHDGSELVRAWTEDTGSAPWIFTPQEWSRSMDVFALQVADMLCAHRVVMGGSPLAGVAVSLRNLRLQAEREVRSELVRMREGLLMAGTDPDALADLLLRSAPSTATYLRAVLHMARRPVPGATTDVARSAAKLVAADPSGFLEVWKARERTADFAPGAGVTDSFYQLLDATARHVDMLTER